jgi:hypothetical protein
VLNLVAVLSFHPAMQGVQLGESWYEYACLRGLVLLYLPEAIVRSNFSRCLEIASSLLSSFFSNCKTDLLLGVTSISIFYVLSHFK